MSGLDELRAALTELDAQGLRRVRRANALPCGAKMRVDGR